MPRHPSKPSQTGWVRIGDVTTDTGMLAIVAPEVAGDLSDTWTARYLDDNGEPLPDLGGPAEHDLTEFEELQLGDDTAILFATRIDGAYAVEARFIDTDGATELTEIRIRLWGCLCTCHGDGQDDGVTLCEGDCHNDDPPQ